LCGGIAIETATGHAGEIKRVDSQQHVPYRRTLTHPDNVVRPGEKSQKTVSSTFSLILDYCAE
jgi:hypothetical protein